MFSFFQYGIVWTVGVFYVIFLEHIGGSKGAVALISSLNTAVFYSTGKTFDIRLLSSFLQFGIVWTGGMFYIIFLEHIQGSKAAVALVSTLNTAVFSGTGKKMNDFLLFLYVFLLGEIRF